MMNTLKRMRTTAKLTRAEASCAGSDYASIHYTAGLTVCGCLDCILG